MTTKSDERFAEHLKNVAERFAEHQLDVKEGNGATVYTLCAGFNKYKDGSLPEWQQSVQLIDVKTRFFMHGDFSQINGMSVVGYSSEIYFARHSNEYVWSKYIPSLSLYQAENMTKLEQASRRELSKAFFYTVRDRFLALVSKQVAASRETVPG